MATRRIFARSKIRRRIMIRKRMKSTIKIKRLPKNP